MVQKMRMVIRNRIVLTLSMILISNNKWKDGEYIRAVVTDVVYQFRSTEYGNAWDGGAHPDIPYRAII